MSIRVDRATGRDSSGKITYDKGGSRQVFRERAGGGYERTMVSSSDPLQKTDLSADRGLRKALESKAAVEYVAAKKDFEEQEKSLLSQGYVRSGETTDASGQVTYNYTKEAPSTPAPQVAPAQSNVVPPLVEATPITRPPPQGFWAGVREGSKFGLKLGIGAGSTEGIKRLGDDGRSVREGAGVVTGAVSGGAVTLGAIALTSVAGPAVFSFLSRVPVLGPAAVRYGAIRAAAPTGGRVALSFAEVGATSLTAGLVAEKAFERNNFALQSVSPKQELQIAREGRSIAEGRAGPVRRFLAEGVSSNVFISPEEQTRGTQEALVASGLFANQEQSRLSAEQLTSRYRNVLGSTEIGVSGFVAERSSEALVRYSAPRGVAYLESRGVSGGRTFLPKWMSGTSSSRTAGVLATQTSVAGGLEGFGESVSSQQIRTGDVRPSEVAVTTIIGAGTAGAFTRFVQAPNIISRASKTAQRSTTREAAEKAFYVLEPYEKLGDVSQDFVERSTRSAPDPVFIRSRGGVVSFSGSSSRSGSSSTSFARARSFDTGVTGLSDYGSLTSGSNVAGLADTRSLSPSSSSFFSSISSGSSAKASTSSSSAAASTSRSVSASTNTKTSSFFPGVPMSPPGGGLGAGGKVLTGSRVKKKGYAPSVAAVAYGITGKTRKGGSFTGLEFRPVSSAAPRRSFISRVAG